MKRHRRLWFANTPSHMINACFALCLLAATGTAHAFLIGPQPPPTSLVYEFFNTGLKHYFYTLDSAEIAAIEAGAAGAGWVRTGLSFAAFSSIEQSGNNVFPACDKQSNPCVAVSRFYGTPGLGPNSHFFTADSAEAEALKRPGSGWSYEGIAFAVPIPDAATGQCMPGYAPIYRSYNKRWMFNDSAHRYTASEVVRSRMQTEGWLDEGIAFCSYGSGHGAIALHSVATQDKAAIQGQAGCNSETAVPRTCIAVSNLSIPATEYAGSVAGTDAFNARTGIFYLGNPKVSTNVALLGGTPDAAAQDLFVQLSEWGNVFGIHLVAPARPGPQYSSITPMQKLPVAAPIPGAVDVRLFPFRAQFNTEYELRLDFTPGVNRIALTDGSDAYGVASIEFVDTLSGRRFRENILAYGTAAEADFVGRDAVDGSVFVATSFKPLSPFGRNASGLTVHMPANFNPLAPYLNPFIWYVNRSEFQALIDSARRLDPALSIDPGDYLVSSFGIKNEISGSGDMGFYLYWISLGLMPR